MQTLFVGLDLERAGECTREILMWGKGWIVGDR